MQKINLYTDGGARGNPGPGAAGAVLKDENGKVIKETSRYLGETTNNQAEYNALILGLEEAKDIKAEEVVCHLDSELVVKQINKEYRVKDEKLAPLFVKVYNLSLSFKKIEFKHVRREQNKEADFLVNYELDKRK